MGTRIQAVGIVIVVILLRLHKTRIESVTETRLSEVPITCNVRMGGSWSVFGTKCAWSKSMRAVTNRTVIGVMTQT